MSNTTDISGFEEFCGGKLWDTNLTWNTDKPNFTPCFKMTVLFWVPCGFLWLLLPIYLYNLSKYPTSDAIRINKLNGVKTFLGILLTIVAALALVVGISKSATGNDPPLAIIITPLILVLTLIVATALIQIERRKGFITSGVLFIFWLLSFIASLIMFYSNIINAQAKGIEDMFNFVIFIVFFILVLIELVLSCFADLPTPIKDGYEYASLDGTACPETTASFISRITYFWINKLVFTGYKRELEESDLWSLHPRDITINHAPEFEEAWAREIELHSSPDQYEVNMNSCNNGYLFPMANGKKRKGSHNDPDESTPLIDIKSNSESKKTPKRVNNASLSKVLAKVYGLTLLQSQCCKFVYDILIFVGPTLQGLLIGYVEGTDEPAWRGYFYAALFFVSGVVQSLFFHQMFHISMTLGMRIKAAVISSVYKKALTMSNEAKKDVTVGEIVNLMSVDAQRLQDVTGYLWMLWSSPFQIILAVYLLWGIVGPSVLAGLAVMILLIPINGVMATFQRKLQISQMKQKDQRVKLINEVLNGIKVLKLYAWELSFQDKIEAIRNIELETLKKYAYLSGFGTFTWTCAPFLVTLATFATYTMLGNQLDANTAFVSLSLFNILRFPINLLPMMISYIVTASVSVKRIGKFLKTGDLDFGAVSHDKSAANPIEIEKGSFAWGRQKDDLTILKNINFNVKDGELVAVVGSVGAGKSSLISSILGEMEKLKGHVNVRGKIAYVPQQAWMQNASLKSNILFGKPYSKNKYEKILDACALLPDLEILPGGDHVEIGEKGINLSGGQKQRISLARAVYNNADIYLLDDPLSAVDAHVGKHIFEKVVSHTGLLKHKTRLLVTHGIQWLPKTDRIFVIDNGEIREHGTYDELLSHDGAFAQFIKTYLLTANDEGDDDDDISINEVKKNLLQRIESINEDEAVKPLLRQLSNPLSPGYSTTSGSESEGAEKRAHRMKRGTSRRKSLDHQLSKQQSMKEDDHTPDKGMKLIEAETSELGEVKWTVFLSYGRALGLVNFIVMMGFFLLYQVASVVSNLWLSAWTEDPILNNQNISTNSSEFGALQEYYLGIYGGLGGAQALFVLVYAIISAISMVMASRKLHGLMLRSILRSPMSFFDTTPIGRILNRFSRDIETIDNILPQLLRSWLNTVFAVFSAFIVISFSTPIFLVIVVPVGLLYYFIQRFYIPTSRQLKRLESTTRSPIYTHFSETITGSSSIRAYREEDAFIKKNEDFVDHNLVFYFSSIASNRWLGFRLELIGSLIVFAAATFAVLSKDTISGGIVGLSISYALQVTQSLNWMVRCTSDLESNVVSVERVKEYSETPSESAWQIKETRPRHSWPDEGKVAFENYQTRYRDGLELVLKGITISVNGGEKVGIVGRTGAGKSSLTLSLFRIIEASQGSIVIDGLDISLLGLHQLRSKLTILPQDPVLFSGSLRMNLDPFDMYSDPQIWSALELAHLREFVETLPARLMYDCGEGGQNLSVGQRQLVCLARTLLRKTKILILDEATAAVDLETDELIQSTIRQEFSECTILTIAHRINTILDNDKVMVLDNGQVAEYDSPENLLAKKKSIFYSMAKESGLVN